MGKSFHLILGTMSAALFACVLPSCQRDTIFDGKSDYRIEISPVYDMLYDRPEKAPSLFRVLLYDPVSHHLVSSNMVGGGGGYLYNIHPGTYDILIYNYTLDRTKVTREENLSLIQAGTSVLAYRSTPVVETPSHLFVEKIEGALIPYLTVNDEPFLIHSEPRSIVDSWVLIIDGIKGLRNADHIDIYISGHSQSIFIADASGPGAGGSDASGPGAGGSDAAGPGNGVADAAGPGNGVADAAGPGDGGADAAGPGAGGSNATICFQAVCDYARELIYTPFTTFGKIPDEKARLELNIRIVGSGGEVYSCSEDVTGQFDDPANLRHEIKATFDVTINERQDGGMRPSAEPWNPDINTLILR